MTGCHGVVLRERLAQAALNAARTGLTLFHGEGISRQALLKAHALIAAARKRSLILLFFLPGSALVSKYSL